MENMDSEKPGGYKTIMLKRKISIKWNSFL